MSKAPFILLVNPWITDFAAYDLWAKPLGLLHLASLLREGGCAVAYLDCLDRHDELSLKNPGIEPGINRRFGTGKYSKMPIPKPEVYGEIPRYYYRYGIHPESLLRKLKFLPKPQLIWVSSVMSYWYPGVQQTIAILKETFGESPIWLGGIYARLCPDHARECSGATEVVTLPAASLPLKIESSTGFALKNASSWARFANWPSPAVELIPHPTYTPILTSIGCPFHCPYCASRTLQPQWERRSGESIYREVHKWHDEYGIADFAFYDDALLLDAEDTLKIAMERLCEDNLEVRFHTPNAIHIRAVTREWAQLLHSSGFTTIRLGLETTKPDHQRKWGGKVENEMFISAVSHLRIAGFAPDQIGAYLLCGLPQQTAEEVSRAIEAVHEAGVMPYLSEYSPVPGTAMWSQAVSACQYDLEHEPLFHNNTFFACRRPAFSYEDLTALKGLAGEARRSIAGKNSMHA